MPLLASTQSVQFIFGFLIYTTISIHWARSSNIFQIKTGRLLQNGLLCWRKQKSGIIESN